MKNYVFTDSGMKRFEDALVRKLAENFRNTIAALHLEETDVIDDSDLDDIQTDAEIDIREIVAETVDSHAILDEE